MRFVVKLIFFLNGISLSLSGTTDLISNISQLTFEGNRSGEGYFSSSNKEICFQAENHPGNPFYQIYTLDLLSGESKLISSGIGKSTCAWIHPAGNQVLFASTHLDPNAKDKQNEEFQQRLSGKAKKYSWDYDPHYDLFLKNRDDSSTTRLTSTFGYDAECAFSPLGDKIVFTSNRHLYANKGVSSDQQIDIKSLSRFNEIYIMDSNGDNLVRLTDHDGYDGGPFFDSSGNHICWRRFSTDGHKAEIFRMSVDGKNKTQLTDLGKMSWAPFFHPSNEYLIFTTNLNGFQNFELYIVDFNGEKKPVRVTEREGFDGLPTFSTDGKIISWTSNATPTKKSQIFLAEWNHKRALELIKSAPYRDAVSDPKNTTNEPKTAEIKNLKTHLSYLTSPDLQGRATGSNGMFKANEYIAKLFYENNLKPFLKNQWYQDFSFFKSAKIQKESYLKGSSNYDLGKEWNPLAFSDSGRSVIKELVFVGYGLRLSQDDHGVDYDSYTHLDVKNKWVLTIRGLPSGWSEKDKNKHYYESTIRKKASVARDLGAKGIIFINDTNSSNPGIIPFEGSTREKISIQAISINNKIRDEIFSNNDKDFYQISKRLNKGTIEMGFSLRKVSLNCSISVKRETGTCQNTIGFMDLNGNGTLDKPYILIGAHLDHIGKGIHSSRAKKVDKGKIHPGADDNGSGIAALLEILRILNLDSNFKGNSRYEIAFATWSGEEIGLVGSSHFANKILSSKKVNGGDKTIVAYLNMDMIGRMKEKMTIHGVGSSSVWRKIIQQANVPVRLNLNLQNDSHIPTDTTSFYSKGVPIISAFTGLHDDYHSPADTEDKINYNGIKKCSSLFSRIVKILGDTQNIDYISQERPSNKNRAKLRAYLGTIPNYSQTDIKGVLLSGVSKNGPADIAGLEEGDIIIKLGEKAVENIYDYTEAIGSLKANEQVNVIVIKDKVKTTLKIIPKAR